MSDLEGSEHVWDGYADFRFGEHSREEYEEQVARDVELEFYREKLRFRGFDEIGDLKAGEQRLFIQVVDKEGKIWNSTISLEGAFEVMPSYVHNGNTEKYVSWRLTPGDLIGEWNAIKAAKNVKQATSS